MPKMLGFFLDFEFGKDISSSLSPLSSTNLSLLLVPEDFGAIEVRFWGVFDADALRVLRRRLILSSSPVRSIVS